MKKIQPRIVCAVVLLLLLFVSSCSGPISVKYGSGKEITLPRRPARIVSLAPSNTEILFALGAGDLVAGVTSFCDFPPEAREKPDVGGFLDFSVEKIVSLKPDLILATTGQDQGLVPLLEAGIPVVVLDAATMDEIDDCVRVVGELTGRGKEARRLIAEMDGEVDDVASRVAGVPESGKPKVLYLAWDAPILTAGSGTLIHHMISLAGGLPIGAETGELYPTLSMESLVMEDPDVLLLPRVHGGLGLDSLRERDAWKELTAVREGRVHLLEDNLISRPGPRAVKGLLEVAKALHPDLFEVKAP